jgi:RHS repeat-associated protein
VTFKYDPFGRRIQKVSPTAGAINCLYDGANIVEEVNASGSSLARYAQNLGIDEPLAMLRGGTNSFYQADGVDSITSLADGSGNAAVTFKYDSFGKLSASAGSLVNPFQYTGRDYDQETGLRYYRARYYDPVLGRFTSEDAIQFRGGDMDFYRYASNSPIGFTDPLGLKTSCMYAGPNNSQLVCWNDGKGPSQSITIHLPSVDPSSIEVAYSNYRQCRGRENLKLGLQVCKPGTTQNPRFADNFGNNADPRFTITGTTDFQKARDCLEKYPLAALDPRFLPMETLNPNSTIEHALNVFFEVYPWSW